MNSSSFYTNYSDEKFLDKLRNSIDCCESFCFSVSFIKSAGLQLISEHLRQALERGATGKLITSTYQNFTDIESLNFFFQLQQAYKGRFECHLDADCFRDKQGYAYGFHSKGYIFHYSDHNEILIGSSNITVYALKKNVEWDVAIVDTPNNQTFIDAQKEFDYLWGKTKPLSSDLITEYKTRLYYSVERWDMDLSERSQLKPNSMQRRALKELNRIRAIGAKKGLIISAPGTGKTFLAAFDAMNFHPNRLLYIVHEGSILLKSYETFQKVFGEEKSLGLFNSEYKETNADYVFSTNMTMADSLHLFSRDAFDYIIVDECHHSTADTYLKIINYFEPQFLLGITATAERMDGGDVLGKFDHNVPYELRLRDAITQGLIVPFHYYGIRDDLVSYDDSGIRKHQFQARFTEQFSSEEHCKFIYEQIEKRKRKDQKLKAIAFCRDIYHANRMSEQMSEYYETRVLTGRNSSEERLRTYRELQDDTSGLNIVFAVDILNEGVDIPGINMVLFLRPTDSQTIFIQQLGRGLRKYEGKDYVTILDFIGNDYKRSVQIAFALGSLSKNFVIEKNLVKALVSTDFTSIGLSEYGVEINLDDLSKKEILNYVDNVNFFTKNYLKQDYLNFKKYINSETYPKHIDYLNNDYAPDLLRFLHASINGKKCKSYHCFLKEIGCESLPPFNEVQIEFLNYLSEMLPIVRPYEYIITHYLVNFESNVYISVLESYVRNNISNYSREAFDHAIEYMDKTPFFNKELDTFSIQKVTIASNHSDYYLEELNDLIEYGLNRFAIDYDKKTLSGSPFCLWAKYRKDQVMQLLCDNPGRIQKGTVIIGKTVYVFVIIRKDPSSDNLNYADGYIDEQTFQWETVARVSETELNKLKNSEKVHVFVRKVEKENSIPLPSTYIGTGKMYYIPNSKKSNGAHLFKIAMDYPADEEMLFDFKLPSI